MQSLIFKKIKGVPTVQFSDVPVPNPKANELLVQIKASSLNNLEISKFRTAILAGKKIYDASESNAKGKILGTDVAGVVVKTGSRVTKFKKGDEIVGITGYLGNAWAEYGCVKEKNAALRPENLTFEESAALPTTGATALSAIKAAHIKPNQRVLIQGATGGVGLFALQMAKSAGAKITAVCSTKNVDLVKENGADRIIDYQQSSINSEGPVNKYDAIIVINGYNSLKDYRNILASNGHLVFIGGKVSQTIAATLFGPLMSLGSQQKIIGTSLLFLKSGWMTTLANMAANKQLRPYLDHIYSWRAIDHALEYASREHIRGKVAIEMDRPKEK